EQEGVLEGARVARAELADALQLALGQRPGVRQEAADHGALAVVHVAHDHDVHAGAARLDNLCHYMYPSRRRVSRPPSSLSWARPERSAMLANLPVFSSSTISETLRASDSTGPVQG